MLFRQIPDARLAQYAYLVGCQRTGARLSLTPSATSTATSPSRPRGLRITHVAETHIHADFLSGAQALAEAAGARLFLSAEGEADGWGSAWAVGREDVTFLHDGDTFCVGHIEIRALHSPGHTPEHLAYLVTDVGGGASTPMGLASGDFVFVGDLGRPDLLESAAGQAGAQEPAARALYASVQRFLGLDDALQVWPGHGAGSACGKALGAVPQSTVGYERAYNGSIAAARRGQDAFVAAILDAQPEPPLYFGRMKRQNRDGVPPLVSLPTPRALAADELADLAAAGLREAVVVDTRADRSAFMAAHLPGALYSPLAQQFNSVVGSFVTDPETPLVLVLPEARLDEAVRDLVRIGYDRLPAYATLRNARRRARPRRRRGDDPVCALRGRRSAAKTAAPCSTCAGTPSSRPATCRARPTSRTRASPSGWPTCPRARRCSSTARAASARPSRAPSSPAQAATCVRQRRLRALPRNRSERRRNRLAQERRRLTSPLTRLQFLMSNAFARFMVSPSGRATRVVAGLGLLGWGLSNRRTAAGKATAALALVPFAAGAFDVCVLGPLLGVPLGGDAARAAVGTD